MPNPIKIIKGVAKFSTTGMNRGRKIAQSTPNAKLPPNAKIRNGVRGLGKKPTLVKGLPGTDMFNVKIRGSNKSLAKKRLMTSSKKKSTTKVVNKKVKPPTKKQIDEHYRSLFKQWND